MERIKHDRSIVLLASLILMFFGCSKDNLNPPDLKFQGAILYEGDTIRVSDGEVRFELWQFGFGKSAPIDLNVAQNGSYSAVLFGGEYHLTVPKGNGPFLKITNTEVVSDTIAFNLDQDMEFNLEVLPYYMFRDVDIINLDGKAVGDFSIERIVNDTIESRDIEEITMYIGETRFVDRRNNIGANNLDLSHLSFKNNLSSDLELSVDIPKDLKPKPTFVYTRIGLKIQGVEDRVFSDLFKLKLN